MRQNSSSAPLRRRCSYPRPSTQCRTPAAGWRNATTHEIALRVAKNRGYNKIRTNPATEALLNVVQRRDGLVDFLRHGAPRWPAQNLARFQSDAIISLFVVNAPSHPCRLRPGAWIECQVALVFCDFHFVPPCSEPPASGVRHAQSKNACCLPLLATRDLHTLPADPNLRRFI